MSFPWRKVIDAAKAAAELVRVIKGGSVKKPEPPKPLPRKPRKPVGKQVQ